MATRVADAGVRAVAVALTAAQAPGAQGALGALGLAVRDERAATVVAVAAGVPGALGAPGAPGALGALGLAVRDERAATVVAVAAGAPGALGGLEPAKGPGATRAPAAEPVAAHAARQAVTRPAESGLGIAAGRRVAAAPAMRHGSAPAGETTRAPTGGVPDRGAVSPGGATGAPTTESMMPAPGRHPGGQRAGLGADRRTGQHAPPARMTPTALLGIAASARIAGRHRGTAAHETAAIAAPAAARAGTGDLKPGAVINAGQAGSVPAGRPTAVTLIAVADREPGSVIARPADTARIGPGGAALAGTCPNGSVAPSQTSGRGVRAAQGRARRSQGRQAGPAGQDGRGGQGARDAKGARAGRQDSVPARALAATATVRTDTGATIAGVTVTGPRRPRRASRIASPRIRYLAR